MQCKTANQFATSVGVGREEYPRRGGQGSPPRSNRDRPTGGRLNGRATEPAAYLAAKTGFQPGESLRSACQNGRGAAVGRQTVADRARSGGATRHAGRVRS